MRKDNTYWELNYNKHLHGSAMNILLETTLHNKVIVYDKNARHCKNIAFRLITCSNRSNVVCVHVHMSQRTVFVCLCSCLRNKTHNELI